MTLFAYGSRVSLVQMQAEKGYSIDRKGLLFYQGKVVIPPQKSLIHELLYLYHDGSIFGALGYRQPKELLERKFHWRGLAKDVREYVLTFIIVLSLSLLTL